MVAPLSPRAFLFRGDGIDVFLSLAEFALLGGIPRGYSPRRKGAFSSGSSSA
jgi:hypothetical protein